MGTEERVTRSTEIKLGKGGHRRQVPLKAKQLLGNT
jgi:hypothetical protein